MIDPDHPRLPVVRQCTLVALSRSTYYYAPREERAFNRQVMRCIDEQFLATPWYGSRQWPVTCGGKGMKSAASACVD